MLLAFRTFCKDCPAELCLRASEDGTSLVVRRFTKEHNHAISRVRQYVVIYTYSLCVMLKAICSGFGLFLTCKTSLSLTNVYSAHCKISFAVWLVHYPGTL